MEKDIVTQLVVIANDPQWVEEQGYDPDQVAVTTWIAKAMAIVEPQGNQIILSGDDKLRASSILIKEMLQFQKECMIGLGYLLEDIQKTGDWRLSGHKQFDNYCTYVLGVERSRRIEAIEYFLAFDVLRTIGYTVQDMTTLTPVVVRDILREANDNKRQLHTITKGKPDQQAIQQNDVDLRVKINDIIATPDEEIIARNEARIGLPVPLDVHFDKVRKSYAGTYILANIQIPGDDASVERFVRLFRTCNATFTSEDEPKATRSLKDILRYMQDEEEV